MGLLKAIKPAVQYFLFHKKVCGKVCACFQCEDMHVAMLVCVCVCVYAQKLEGSQSSKALPASQGYFLVSGLI